ncbi:RNA polymerase sigma factor [Yeosuana marina]|uniref:RNA polymerase sigma factor n=1 Tax=Yeosuana marina TaxID=1565536 RepID=UPI001423558D|nr:sigma-70 family RNA polymerase sigma factor [Yeosuana marina]
MKNEKVLLPKLFKTEYRKIISVLCNTFGLSQIEIAEDIASDTFALASETWGLKGIPDNPTAWLYTVAKNRAKDYFKREKIFSEKILPEVNSKLEKSDEIRIDFSKSNINDSQLKMIFVLCNPNISQEAQIGLCLRILCGLGIDEIAEAFLTKKQTIEKRLFRAKLKLKKLDFKIEIPKSDDLTKRLDTVLATLYLLFNEGYCSNSKNLHLRKELCFEAMRLNYMLIENDFTNKPGVNALMALMCFHSSRFEARTNKSGEPVLYYEQDKQLWSQELVHRGNYFLTESARGDVISKYHLEASIAYWHSTKIENPKKWNHILELYNKLLQIKYTPTVALNRTFALSKVYGSENAIAEAYKLKLDDNHFYHTLLAILLQETNKSKAIEHLNIALKIAKSDTDKNTITNYLNKLYD